MGTSTVSLVVGGPRLDPEVVTAALGMSPSDAHRACDPSLRKRYGDHIWRIGMWRLARKNVAIDDVAQVVRELAEIFRRGQVGGHGLGAEGQHVSVGLFGLRGTGEAFYLEPPLLQDLASLGLTLMVDVYGDSSEVDEH